jgi:RNA polymerase sigma-70 factor, ECF subfamily
MQVTTSCETPAIPETERLMACARQGDAEAFSRLAETHERRLYQQALALCGDSHTAEDLTVDTLVEAWRGLERFGGRCRFSTWLYAILLRLHLKRLRSNRSRPLGLTFSQGADAGEEDPLLDQWPDGQPTAPDQLAEKETADRMRRALSALPEGHRSVILLRFYEDASLAEIAEALELPLGTVKSRLHHALASLRQMEMVVNLFEEERNIKT